MDRSLSWNIEDKNGTARVSLAGELTENSNLGTLLEKLGGPAVFDLSGINRINSPGVREWINFVNALRIPFSLERCSVAFVNQLNMISNFRGQGEVRSVFAPYYCSSCNREENRLIDKGPNAAAQLETPMKCPSCGADMEFDDLPDAFLAFWS